MANKFEQNPKKQLEILKHPDTEILETLTMIDEDSLAGSCLIKIRVRNKKLKIIVGLKTNGEIWMSNVETQKVQENLGDEAIEDIKEYAGIKFNEEADKLQIKIAKRNLKKLEEEDKRKGAPKCKKCGSYHWPQDPCSDWAD